MSETEVVAEQGYLDLAPAGRAGQAGQVRVKAENI